MRKNCQPAVKNPGFQAYQLLRWAFVIARIIAGIDKFFMKLTDWTQYLWPPLGRGFGTPHMFMEIAGAIEIVAGFLVAFVPKLGGYIVAFWLWGISPAYFWRRIFTTSFCEISGPHSAPWHSRAWRLVLIIARRKSPAPERASKS